MKTPLKFLLFGTIGISLLACFSPTIKGLLALSWVGIDRLYLWQFITYIFVEKGSFNFSFVISLAFNMYLLWIFGLPLYERAFAKKFFTLYFGGALLGGVSAMIFPQFVLAGSRNPIFSLLVVWMMLNPGSQLLLFFTLPFKAYILVFALIGISLFFDITSGDWVGAISLLTSCIYGYFFALLVWRTHSPFPFFRSFERTLFKFFENRKRKKMTRSHSKIYDIRSGEPISDDDKFMNAMLDRISRHGKDSLTPQEKKRMDQISKKRKK